MGRRERELFLMLPWHHQTDCTDRDYVVGRRERELFLMLPWHHQRFCTGGDRDPRRYVVGRRERELFLMLPWHHQTDSVLAGTEIQGGMWWEGGRGNYS